MPKVKYDRTRVDEILAEQERTKLRDKFATAAMIALLPHVGIASDLDRKFLAADAYNIAEAMMDARARREKG